MASMVLEQPADDEPRVTPRSPSFLESMSAYFASKAASEVSMLMPSVVAQKIGPDLGEACCDEDGEERAEGRERDLAARALSEFSDSAASIAVFRRVKSWLFVVSRSAFTACKT